MEGQGRIHFLDLGAGQNPDRIKALASQHPGKPMVAVDIQPLGDHETLPANVIHVASDALRYLKTLEENSVQIANADFLLNEMPDDEITELIQHIKRVLTPNGKLYISEDRQNVDDIRQFLHTHGFRTFARDITQKEAANAKTWFTQERLLRPQYWVDSRKNKRVTWPVRIVATKRV